MNLAVWNEKFKNCTCGRVHLCPIDSIVIGKDAISKLPQLCEAYANILLVCDVNTYEVCGKNVKRLLGEKIESEVVLLSNGDVVIPNEEKIAETEEKITCKTEFVLGVGSGVINDLCKYVSMKHELSYGIVATAPSMDGYASSGAALILNGMKITKNAQPPKMIVGDTGVLKNAPEIMLQAGYGDILGKLSCLNDWKLSALLRNEYFCREIYDFTLMQVKKVAKCAKEILNREEKGIEALMEALVAVGVAMSYAGNSRPASGSEHHLSHFFEITGILENKGYYPHGIDVMYSAAETAGLREEILQSAPVPKTFDRKKWETEIKRIYGASADEVISLQNAIGWYEEDDRDTVLEKWEDVKAILHEAPTFSEALDMLSEIGLSYDAFVSFYGAEKIHDGILYAKDLKDRYSVLWLYYKYFGK